MYHHTFVDEVLIDDILVLLLWLRYRFIVLLNPRVLGPVSLQFYQIWKVFSHSLNIFLFSLLKKFQFGSACYSLRVASPVYRS